MSVLQEIIADFQQMSREEKLDTLMDYSENLPELPERYHEARDKGQNRLHECQTPVHLWVEIHNGKVQMFVDVPRESPTVRGFVALLMEAFHDNDPQEALNCPNTLLNSLGLVHILGITRLNGLSWLVKRLKQEVTKACAES